MGHDLRYTICQVGAKRLALVISLVLTSVIAIQYFELPYSTTIRSIFSSENQPQVTGLSISSNEAVSAYVQLSNSSEDKGIGVKNDLVLQKNRNSTADNGVSFNAVSPTIPPNSSPADSNPSFGTNFEDNTVVVIQEENISIVSSPAYPALVTDLTSATRVNISPTPLISIIPNASSENNSTGKSRRNNNTKPVKLHNKGVIKARKEAVSISDMNDLLLQSRTLFSMKPRWSSAVDQELRSAKLQIKSAAVVDNHPGLYAPIFRNISMFKRSYELMEKTLKVYVYEEGERPIFHKPVLKGIYASEGWFMKLIKENKHFVTKNPKNAHLFYLPFSSRVLEETLYVPNSHSRRNLVHYLKNYIDLIAGRYRFWNRTDGSDHFLVACHDWASSETKRVMANCIRALCNSDVKEGFKFGKDVSLPETYVRSAGNPLRELGGKPPSQRKTLSFFAGKMHGYVRPVLLQHWKNKDPDMKIFGRMPKSNYTIHMKSSKYCICAKGFEVNSPRVVEAIFYECVPVIISDNFVPPFFEFLNWESFAVFVSEKDIPDLKDILISIPKQRYLEMNERVKQVQQHFLWHVKPVKYDLFHMILHSIWFNRVFRMKSA